MKILLFILISFVGFGQIIPTNTAVDVYLIGGQSNANGSNSAITSSTVPYYFENGNVKIFDGSNFVNLSIQNNNNQQPSTSQAAQFSWASIFSQKIVQTSHNPVYLIQYAAGGTILANIVSSVTWNPNQAAGLYPYFRNNYKSAMAWINTNKIPYNIRGFIWYQGESDAAQLTYAASYRENLKILCDSVRLLTGISNLPIKIVRIHSNTSLVSYPYKDTVRLDQENYALSDANSVLWSVDGYTLGADNIHLNAASHISFGEWIATQVVYSVKSIYAWKR